MSDFHVFLVVLGTTVPFLIGFFFCLWRYLEHGLWGLSWIFIPGVEERTSPAPIEYINGLGDLVIHSKNQSYYKIRFYFFGIIPWTVFSSRLYLDFFTSADQARAMIICLQVKTQSPTKKRVF